MDARIMVASGKSTRGKLMGCAGNQLYAVVLDASRRDESGHHPELYVTGPHDDGFQARAEIREWARANGIEIGGNHQPRGITGADADIRANSPRGTKGVR